MPKEPFYAGGLRFSCVQCSSCCRHEPGFVFLSKEDADMLAVELKMRYTDFVKTYCRWVTHERGERLSLREKSNFDCILWQEGCSVYKARPLQCRTFPFWTMNMSSPEAWERTRGSCPGAGKGPLHGRGEIQKALRREAANRPLSRGVE